MRFRGLLLAVALVGVAATEREHWTPSTTVLSSAGLASVHSTPSPPRDPQAVEAELALARPVRRLIQQGLAVGGFDSGTPDGVFGPHTRAAIKAWQAAREEAQTGYLDAAQAEVLTALARPVASQEVQSLHAAAERGDVDAQFNLGVMYANGDGVIKDMAEAVRWWRLAAEQGDVDAQYALGSVYAGASTGATEALWEAAEDPLPFLVGLFLGRGVRTDFVLAHMWLNIAAANGHEDAGLGRDGIELFMSHADISRATELARECMASDYRDCAHQASGAPATNAGWQSTGEALPSDAYRPERRHIPEMDGAHATAAAPEPQVSGSEFFTRGSHQDDVLRLQGTPDSIRAFSDSEIWWYGLSTVTISTQSREVTEWSDSDGNLRVRLVPGSPSSGPPRISEPTPGAGIVNPRLLREVKPQYTAEALRAKITGTVHIELVVLPDGAVGDVRITRSLDPVYGLDDEAVKAARQWLFEPGTRYGEPIAVLVNVALDFNLR